MTSNKRPVIMVGYVGNVTYQLELVTCGKPTCRRCPHGPYWYAYCWDNKRQRTKSTYVGKELPEGLTLSGKVRLTGHWLGDRGDDVQ